MRKWRSRTFPQSHIRLHIKIKIKVTKMKIKRKRDDCTCMGEKKKKNRKKKLKNTINIFHVIKCGNHDIENSSSRISQYIQESSYTEFRSS